MGEPRVRSVSIEDLGLGLESGLAVAADREVFHGDSDRG